MIEKTECNLKVEDIQKNIVNEAIFHMELAICHFNDYASLVLIGTEYENSEINNKIEIVNKYEIISNDSLSEENNRKLSITFSWYKNNDCFFFEDLFLTSAYLDSGDTCIDSYFSDTYISEPILAKYYEITVLKEKETISNVLNNDVIILKNKNRI